MSLPTSSREAPTSPDFGKDAQEFIKHFDKIRDESDGEMINHTKDGLDSLLVYAGLFSAVDSAFLIYTLPDLKPNPVDDTNALLLHLIQLSDDPKNPTKVDLPSYSFSPGPREIQVNRLFLCSLMLALVVAFLIVWAREWLKFSQSAPVFGSKVEQQRWIYFGRFLRGERGGLHMAFRLLPVLTLWLALACFTMGLMLHIGILDPYSGRSIVFSFMAPCTIVWGLTVALQWDSLRSYHAPLWVLMSNGIHIIITIASVSGHYAMRPIAMVQRIFITLRVWIRSAGQGRRIFGDCSRARDWNANEERLQVVDGHVNLRMDSRSQVDGPSQDLTNSLPHDARRWGSYSPKLRWIEGDLIHTHGIIRMFTLSSNPEIHYYTAAHLCGIEDPECLKLTFGCWATQVEIWRYLCEAINAQAKSNDSKMSAGELLEIDKRIVIFGTALLHIYFSAGSLKKLLEFTSSKSSTFRVHYPGNDIKLLRAVLSVLWSTQTSVNLRSQPPVFTSVILAVGLLLRSLEPSTSIFNQEKKLFSCLLNSVSSRNRGSWNQLALLTMVCTRSGGRGMDINRDEHFHEMQNAYNTTQPTAALADAIYQVIQSDISEKTRLPCEVFKLAWKLFVHGREKGDAARALGRHAPFLGLLEARVRDDDKTEDYREYFRGLRSECFAVVLKSVRSFKRVETSAIWRFQAKFVFRAVGHYAMHIMALWDARHVENARALDFVRCIRALVPYDPPADAASSNPVGGQQGTETEYTSNIKAFKDTCERFESFVRSGQVKMRVAPEDQWCFSR